MLTRLRLLPHDEQFFVLFNEAAANVRDGAEVLARLMDGAEEPAAAAEQLDRIEHRGDELTRAVFVALNRTFVTPIDREDIGALAAALDDVIDWIEEVGKRVSLYRIAETRPLARRLGQIVLSQVEALARAMPLVEDRHQAEELQRVAEQVHALENEADDLLAEAVSHLYDGVAEVPGLIHAIRWGDLYQLLEDTTDKAEHVAVVLQNIALKNA
jgi:uncharacterized protein